MVFLSVACACVCDCGVCVCVCVLRQLRIIRRSYMNGKEEREKTRPNWISRGVFGVAARGRDLFQTVTLRSIEEQ